MKKLLLFALIAFAAWYGWNHYRSLIDRHPSHEAEIRNGGTSELVRVRLIVGDQTFVKESIPAGASATIPFRVNQDATFRLIWQWTDRQGEHEWKGGMVPRGPMVQRHIFIVDDDGEVIYQARNKSAPAQ